jgi:condensin complex subunit 2
MDNESLFNMLAGLADDDANGQGQGRKGKKGVSVQDLGYNVIFTGGERTLEKDTKNIDVTKFDIEAEIDPLFRQRTARFDESGAKNLLINITLVDKGINV